MEDRSSAGLLLPLPSPSPPPASLSLAAAVPHCKGAVLAHDGCGPLVLDPPTSTPGGIPYGGDTISTVLGMHCPLLLVLPVVGNGTVTCAASCGKPRLRMPARTGGRYAGWTKADCVGWPLMIGVCYVARPR